MAVKQQVYHAPIVTHFLLCLLLQTCRTSAEDLKWDENGYVLYCPCMGNSFFVADNSHVCILLYEKTTASESKTSPIRKLRVAFFFIDKGAYRLNMKPNLRRAIHQFDFLTAILLDHILIKFQLGEHLTTY